MGGGIFPRSGTIADHDVMLAGCEAKQEFDKLRAKRRIDGSDREEYRSRQAERPREAGLADPQAPARVDDGGTASLNDTRVRARNTHFESDTTGVYAQDTLSLTPQWKLIAGLRYDRFSGDYERVAGPLSRTDIVEVIGQRVELKRAGKEFKGLSPFSNEKSPSFFVSPAKQMFFDFSSGKNGTILANMSCAS